jgi:hypothetical protein
MNFQFEKPPPTLGLTGAFAVWRGATNLQLFNV